MTAVRLTTKYVEKPWGRTELPEAFPHGGGARVGEIWFDGPEGQQPPLLVKYIFTCERLSIQVHPNDAQARDRGLPGGKHECWLILEADANAKLGIGTVEPLDSETLRSASQDGSIEELIDWKPVKAGDFFYIPPGTVHAIGAGLTLIEVQQNIDVTYRLYDYGRPRELHLDDGVAVSRAEPYDHPAHNLTDVARGELQRIEEPPFNLRLETLHAGEHSLGAAQSPQWFIPFSGQGTLDGQAWQAGECWMITGDTRLTVNDKCRTLIAGL